MRLLWEDPDLGVYWVFSSWLVMYWVFSFWYTRIFRSLFSSVWLSPRALRWFSGRPICSWGVQGAAQDVVNIGSQCVHLTSGFYAFVVRGSRFRRLLGFFLLISHVLSFFFLVHSHIPVSFFFSLIISSGTAVILWQANLFLGCTTVIVTRVSKQRRGILFLNNAMQETLKD